MEKQQGREVGRNLFLTPPKQYLHWIPSPCAHAVIQVCVCVCARPCKCACCEPPGMLAARGKGVGALFRVQMCRLLNMLSHQAQKAKPHKEELRALTFILFFPPPGRRERKQAGLAQRQLSTGVAGVGLELQAHISTHCGGGQPCGLTSFQAAPGWVGGDLRFMSILWEGQGVGVLEVWG